MSADPDFWEYNVYPNAADVEKACADIVARASADAALLEKILLNTRDFHREMFHSVTPPNRGYFAGNYRGAPFPILDHYGVMVPVAGKVYHGHPPKLVESAMAAFHVEINSTISFFKEKSSQLNWTPRKKIAAFAKLVGALFVKFLAIHPYANGNGHISRLIVWAVFSINSVNSSFWSVPHRNVEPPDLQVAQYRDGFTEPLVQTFVKLIAMANPPAVA